MSDLSQHWTARYTDNDHTTLSWWTPHLQTSFRLLLEYAPSRHSLLDVGAGASTLAADAVAAGWTDVTILDIARPALEIARDAVGDAPITLIEADIRTWEPKRHFDTWHDRATFHFLTDDRDIARYASLVRRALTPGGSFILGTFAPDGPEMCSGLPVRRWRPDDVNETFAAVGPLVHHETEDHITPLGVVQSFNWFVIRRDQD